MSDGYLHEHIKGHFYFKMTNEMEVSREWLKNSSTANMKRPVMRKLSCTEGTAPLRSYGDTSRRIRKLNKHPIDALILRRGGILAHSRGREKDSGERNDRHLHEAFVQRIRRTVRRERRETGGRGRGGTKTWQSE